MAGLYKLPHIFVVENNRWAIGMSHLRATSTTLGDQEPYIYKKVRCFRHQGWVKRTSVFVAEFSQTNLGPLFDMPGVHVDGMDVLKVLHCAGGTRKQSAVFSEAVLRNSKHINGFLAQALSVGTVMEQLERKGG
eukprot:1160849-Pelagomonas_calceolata.AAC.4